MTQRNTLTLTPIEDLDFTPDAPRKATEFKVGQRLELENIREEMGYDGVVKEVSSKENTLIIKVKGRVKMICIRLDDKGEWIIID